MTDPAYADDSVTVYAGDCLDVVRELPASSVDAVITDPPYSLSFMGKSWDEHTGREDAALGYWLAGFIDGEGCFLVKGHSRGTYAPVFYLKVRRDDRAALEQARRFVGAGQIEDVEGEGGSRPQVRWAVQDREGCQRLVDVLDKYPLRAKKRLDYLSWREAVCEWTDRPRGNRWAGAADQSRMRTLRERTSDVKGYADPAWSGHEYADWCRLWAQECYRVLKPGGHLLAFGGTRTWHRLAIGIEDAGFELRDSIAWVYSQGFPKSLDVGKAIAKTGADPESWTGWGTALKPSFEPIVVARRPLSGTVATNVLRHGTGALNIDACRLTTDDNLRGTGDRPLRFGGMNARPFHDRAGEPSADRRYTDSGGTDFAMTPGPRGGSELGRWPANVVLTHDDSCEQVGEVYRCVPGCPVRELDAQTGTLTSGANPERRGTDKFRDAYGTFRGQEECEPARGANSGGASRFYPAFRYEAKAGTDQRPRDGDVAHPTVKPVDLMRWLVRLVTPVGGVVLDPFLGSGTTAEACVVEGVRCIGVERDPSYLPLIRARLGKPIPLDLFGLEA